jgi:hypothetical protein
MKTIISIPSYIEASLHRHLFQGELEQGSFLFANPRVEGQRLNLSVIDFYLVPPEGWQVQLDVYLEMKDTERAKIMNLARKDQFAVIDCHSHPGSNGAVAFSPSDRNGITDFALYAKWKLADKPFSAVVWGETSLDAVVWYGDFQKAQPVDMIQILDKDVRSLKPNGSWFINNQKSWWRSVFRDE